MLYVSYISESFVICGYCNFRNFDEVVHLEIKHTAQHFSLQDAEQFESPLDIIHHYLNGNTLKKNGSDIVHLKTPLVVEETIKSR